MAYFILGCSIYLEDIIPPIPGSRLEQARSRLNQVWSSKLIFLLFNPTNHFKDPNKQKTSLLFSRFDILTLSKIISFSLDLQLNTIKYNSFATFQLLITWQSF